MYTYLISAALSLLVMSCIYRKGSNTDNLMGKMLILLFITLLISVIVSLIRIPKLQDVDEVYAVDMCNTNHLIYKEDTTYIWCDSIINADKTVTITQKALNSDSIPNDSAHVRIIVNQFNANVSLYNDTITLLSNDFEMYIIPKGNVIYESDITAMISRRIVKKGDNWAPGWMIPASKYYTVVWISHEDMKVLRSLDSNLAEKWTIEKH